MTVLPLDGIKVRELGHAIAAPHCAQILGDRRDYGAYGYTADDIAGLLADGVIGAPSTRQEEPDHA